MIPTENRWKSALNRRTLICVFLGFTSGLPLFILLTLLQAWLAKHPRFAMQFTPTSASWLNMVERFFRDISEHRIERDSFISVAELELAIDLYIVHHNAHPKPFI